jgi:hypothetical protein
MNRRFVPMLEHKQIIQLNEIVVLYMHSSQ